jgi:hypothetical protein
MGVLYTNIGICSDDEQMCIVVKEYDRYRKKKIPG